MPKIITYTILTFFILSINSDIQRKVIRQGEFDITCYVSLKKKLKTEANKEYFWFKNGEIHSNYSGIGGLVLHDTYTKYYRSKQLAEMGTFNYGLKHGEWKSWFENGILKEIFVWKNGTKQGIYYKYNEFGELIWSGKYKNGQKSNIWINHKTKDTTYYLKDTISKTRPKSKFSKFLKRLFKKKDKDTLAKSHTPVNKRQ